jgi:protein-tyrosine-phosphatase
VRVLFVCTQNICRSRVGEELFRLLTWGVRGRKEHEARSAGTDPSPGGRLLTRRDVTWADVICVMEASHEEFIRRRWPAQGRKIRVLGIPDVYMPDDPELREQLAQHVRQLLAG